jgi:hypothetical protein
MMESAPCWNVRLRKAIKIYDTFLLDGELDLLEYRLRENYDDTDIFVLVEAWAKEVVSLRRQSLPVCLGRRQDQSHSIECARRPVDCAPYSCAGAAQLYPAWAA